ncbi:MAG: hypothetical protein V4486_02925 [Patescibacteria group bacterium]
MKNNKFLAILFLIALVGVASFSLFSHTVVANNASSCNMPLLDGSSPFGADGIVGYVGTASGSWGITAVGPSGTIIITNPDQFASLAPGSYSGTFYNNDANCSDPVSFDISGSSVNGICAATHYSCTSGTSANNLSNLNNWTWTCQGTGGNNNASCSETKTCQDPAALNYGAAAACQYSNPTCQDINANNYNQPLPCTYPALGTAPTVTAVPPACSNTNYTVALYPNANGSGPVSWLYIGDHPDMTFNYYQAMANNPVIPTNFPDVNTNWMYYASTAFNLAPNTTYYANDYSNGGGTGPVTSWNVPNCPLVPDLKVSALSYVNSDGPITIPNGTSYTLSWAAVSTATSCTLDGAPASVNGGSIGTYVANSPSITHILSCMNSLNQTASDAVTILSSMSGSLASPGCQIALGGSSCNTNITWSVINHESTSSAITAVGMANRNYSGVYSGIDSFAVPGAGRTFFLYNNSKSLYPTPPNGAGLTIVPSCASGSWNGSTCALTPVAGICGATNNSCSQGTYQDLADNSTTYLWNCNGINGGATDHCSLAKPTGPVVNNDCPVGISSGNCCNVTADCPAGTTSATFDGVPISAPFTGITRSVCDTVTTTHTLSCTTPSGTGSGKTTVTVKKQPFFQEN